MEQADRLFGMEDVVLQKFSDPAGVMRMRERKPMRKILKRFEKRFPQLFVSVYIEAFEELSSIREFGYWLLNRADFSDVEVARPNENGILIVIDVKGKTAGITYGYSLLPYLNDENTFKALSKAHPYLIQGEYLQGIERMVISLEKTLVTGWRKARWNPGKTLATSGQNPVEPSQGSMKSLWVGMMPSNRLKNIQAEEATQ